MSEIKTNTINPALWKDCLSNKYLWLMSIILSIAIAIRIMFFVGFSLGDDPYNAGVVNLIMNHGFQTLPLIGANYRIGLYLPMLLFFSIFGINDLSLVLFPLLASLGSIIVIYFIGKELFGKETGLIAAILLALCPFDTVFASTLTIDIPLSFFIALSFLFFLKGDACTGKKHILYFVLSATFLFYGYLIKITAYFIFGCLAIVSLIKIKSFKQHLVFYGSTTILLLISFTADYLLSGHPLNRLHSQLATAVQPSLWDVSILRCYPNWMFKRMGDGSLLFGYYFYLTIPALICISITRRKQAFPVLIWFLVLFLIMEFMPQSFELPYKLPVRYARYLHILLIPSVVILAAGFHELLRLKKTVFVVVLVTFLASAIVEAHNLSKKWKEPIADAKEASKFLLTLPEKPVYSDRLFLQRFNFDAQYKKGHLIVPWDTNAFNFAKKKDFNELKKIHSGYVVAGGSRSVEIPRWSIFIFNLDDNKPPQNWKLVKEISKELTLYRKETLKIYEVLPE